MWPSVVTQVKLDLDPRSPKLRMTLCSFYLDAGFEPKVEKLEKIVDWIGESYDEYIKSLEEIHDEPNINGKSNGEDPIGGGYV